MVRRPWTLLKTKNGFSPKTKTILLCAPAVVCRPPTVDYFLVLMFSNNFLKLVNTHFAFLDGDVVFNVLKNLFVSELVV